MAVTAWLINRPGAAQVLAEAIGQSSTSDRWLYFSDGGHLDNTGLVEAVRLHRTEQGFHGRIVVVDASNHSEGTWSAVGDAMGVVRMEFGVDLRCMHGTVAQAPAPSDGAAPAGDGPVDAVARRVWRRSTATPPGPYMRVYEHADGGCLLEVLVVKAVRPAMSSEVPESVRAFAAPQAEFPRASTSPQDFGDIEFEAYRTLGEHSTLAALDEWDAHRARHKRG